MSFNFNTNIDFNNTMHYPKFSMATLQTWVIKSGVLKNVFILCEHGTKANIGGAKMANNRHAVNSNFLQSYWTSDWLSFNPLDAKPFSLISAKGFLVKFVYREVMTY